MEEEKVYLIIGEMIRRARLSKGITLGQIADKLGVAAITIQRYEIGGRKIDMGMLIKIIDILGLNYTNFMNEVQSKVTDNAYEQEETIAAHHDGEEWTEEELKAIEDFKAFVKSKRNK